MHLRCIDLWQVCEKNNNTGNSYCNVKSVSIKKVSSIAETRSEKMNAFRLKLFFKVFPYNPYLN